MSFLREKYLCASRWYHRVDFGSTLIKAMESVVASYKYALYPAYVLRVCAAVDGSKVVLDREYLNYIYGG
jgi:hypothetical protein